jgi:hypothetical protein
VGVALPGVCTGTPRVAGRLRVGDGPAVAEPDTVGGGLGLGPRSGGVAHGVAVAEGTTAVGVVGEARGASGANWYCQTPVRP